MLQHLRSDAQWINDAHECECEEWPELNRNELHKLEAEMIKKNNPKHNKTSKGSEDRRKAQINWLTLCADRAQEMQRMYSGGLTYEKIGERFGVSRQRVFQIINEDRKTAPKKKSLDFGKLRDDFKRAQIAWAKKTLGMK